MRALLLCLAVVALVGCPGPKTSVDAGAEDAGPPAYDGTTSGGAIPELPEGAQSQSPLIDAGLIVVDAGCCPTQFQIDDQEPADATGRLVGALEVFHGGTALTRGGGLWTASLCFPVETSGTYRYEFTWDGGVEDGGTVDLDDGGVETILIPVVGFSARASATEPGFVDATGDRWNLFGAVSSCDGLDGSVP